MPIKKLALALAVSALLATGASAQSPVDPVKNLMDLSEALWREDPKVEGQDYFDASRLDALYSKSFAADYRAAAKFPIYEDSAGPFGYDVIANGQDGCPLKDVAITPGATTNGVTDVKVTFKLFTCIDDGSVDKDSVSEVHFDVITENGRPVINDIHRKGEDGTLDSLVKEMHDIVASGQDVGPDAKPADATPAPDDKGEPTITLSEPE